MTTEPFSFDMTQKLKYLGKRGFRKREFPGEVACSHPPLRSYFCISQTKLLDLNMERILMNECNLGNNTSFKKKKKKRLLEMEFRDSAIY